MTRLVTVAHGTRSGPGNAVAARLTDAAGARLGIESVTSYVELCAPLFADVVAGEKTGGRTTVVVPLLLSTGFHMRHDLPGAVAAAHRSENVRMGGPLGPDPLLAEVMAARLHEAGARRGQPVVMLAAGSRDPSASEDLEASAGLLAATWGAPVRLATLAGLGRRPAEMVRPGDAVAPYLLAPGHFATHGCAEAVRTGADVVAAPLGAHPLLVDLLVQRASRLLDGEAARRAVSGSRSG